MAKTKTLKIVAVDPNTLERLDDVPVTQKVDIKSIKINSFEKEIANLSYDDLEYKLNFEVTDHNEREIIKNRMKQLKNK